MRYKAEFISNTGQYDCKVFDSQLAASQWLGRKSREPTRVPERTYPEFPVKRKKIKSKEATNGE